MTTFDYVLIGIFFIAFVAICLVIVFSHNDHKEIVWRNKAFREWENESTAEDKHYPETKGY